MTRAVLSDHLLPEIENVARIPPARCAHMVNGRSGFKCVKTPREVGDGGVNGNPLCNTHWRGTNERSEEDVCREGELKIGYRKNGRSERICISGPCLPKADGPKPFRQLCQSFRIVCVKFSKLGADADLLQ
jgi:hypothetical protein